MLHYNPPFVVNGLHNRLRQNGQGGERHFKADVHMVAVGGEEAVLLVLVEQGQGANVYAVVVVGKLKAGEQTLDEGAFAGACFAYVADYSVEGAEVELRNLYAEVVNAVAPPGTEKFAVNMVFLHSV